MALLAPAAALIAWNTFSAHRYGVALVGDAAAVARHGQESALLPVVWRSVNALCFVGGGTLAVAAAVVVAFVSPGGRLPRLTRVAMPVATAAAIGVVAAVVCRTPAGWSVAGGPPAAAYYLQFGMLATAGVAVLVACVTGARHGDHRRGWFLLIWVAGVFVFAALVNWTVNVRSLLPLVPAAAVLAARALDGRRGWAVPAAVGLAAAVSAALAVSEHRVAVANRDVALRSAAGSTPVWFMGHWGFQYYMQLAGGRPIDAGHRGYAAGDRVVLPLDNDGSVTVPADVEPLGRIEVGTGYWLTTMNNPMGGGFYASFGDRLPFVVGPIPPEAFLVGRVRR